MSIKVQTIVWDSAPYSGGTLLVLLKMADFANDDGTGIYPKQSYLATKVRMTDRAVRDCLKQLEDDGVIVRVGKRAGGIVEWRITDAQEWPEDSSARKPTAGSPGSGLPTEPSVEPPVGEANASPTSSGVLKLKYAEPETPGSAAAPWLVYNLARLMRDNDAQAKLPAALNGPFVRLTGTADEQMAAARSSFDVQASNVKDWLDSARLLIDTDKRVLREVAITLNWCQVDDFWRTNILSMPTFRKQFPKMREKALREHGVMRPADRQPNQRAQLDALTKSKDPDQEEE